MSKKFTSLLVLATAMLLAVPTQAQVAKKAPKTQVKAFKTGKVDKRALEKGKAAQKKEKAAQMKAQETPVQGIAFRGGQAAKQQRTQSLEEAQALKAADQTVSKPIAKWDWAAHQTPKFVSKSGILEKGKLFNAQPVNLNRTITASEAAAITAKQVSSGKRAARRAEAVTLPDGVELVEYALSYETNTGEAGYGTAAVAVDGNDVYFKGFSIYIPDALIKGTKSGNTITFPANQYLGSYAGYDSYLYVSATFTYDAETDTYTSTDQVYSVLGGQYYDANYYNPVLKGIVEQAATPANPSVTNLKNGNYGYYITFNVPNVDTEGNGLVSSKLFYEIYTDIEHDVQPLTFTPETHVQLTEDMTIIPFGFTEGYDFYANTIYLNDLYSDAWNKIGIKSIYTGGGETHETEIQWYTIKNYADFAVDAPYTADLTQEGAIADFFVIDNNSDGYTWNWNEDYASYGIYYQYSSDNNADDYLILPIKLEAQKNYNVVAAVNAASTYYAEKFEVKVGKEGTVAGLNQTVIAEQEVTSIEPVDYEGDFTTDEAGTYYVAIHATSDADKYRLCVTKLTIEAGAEGDAPAAVSDFAVTPLEDALGATVAFTAPTKTVDGSDLAADGITKIDILRDGNVIKTIEAPAPGSAQNYVDQASDLTIGTHKYQVIPYGASGIGGKSEEISVFLTATLDVPYYVDFTVSGSIEAFQVIDNNEDLCTWAWHPDYNAYYNYNSEVNADDYLVSSPIRLQAGKNYNVTVNAQAWSVNYPEKFEVKVGKEATAAGLTQTVIAETEINNTEGEDFEGQFSVTEDGEYYIAIHATSDANMWRLIINSLAIELGAEPTAPAAPEIEVVPGAEGDLSATVKVTAPTTSVDGNALTDNIDIDVLRDGVVISTKTDVAPGTLVRVFDEPVPAGFYTYQAIPSNASGKGLKSEKVKVFIGTDELGAAQNFAVAGTTANTISFTWDAAQGANGGYVDAANVTYTIYSLAIESNGYWNYLVADETLASVTGETAATINFPMDEGDQQYKYFGISVKNATTEESDPAENYTYVLAGAPYDLPIEEGFAGNSLHYNWNYNDDAVLMVSDEATDGDGVALVILSYEDNATNGLWIEKVNLKNAVNPTLIFDVKSDEINSVRVIGSKDGEETATLASEAISGEYKTVKVPLANIVGSRYSTVGFEADFANASTFDWWYGTLEEMGDALYVDNIKIVDLLEYNLGVTVDAPATVTAGQKATITATVENKGENAAEGYSIVIKAGDKELLNKTVNEALAPFQKSEVTAELETSVFDEAGDVTITAEVVYMNDLDEDDNKADAIITIKEPTAQAPENLTATDKGDAGVELAWSAPGSTDAAARAGAAEETENFDDESIFEPFSLGGITADQQTGAFGDWTLYDGNNMTVYGFSGITFPNAYAEAAWQVFNTTGDGEALAENGFGAHSGNQYLMSFCPVNESSTPAANHWLISPELPGIAQTISFYARAITGEYGAETFEVLASSTDNKPESFTIVGSAYSTTATEWTEYTAELPAGTKFFAIRHTSQDIFGLMVDDVTYLVGGAEVASYNIYYESELIASVTGDVTTYTVAGNKIQAGNRTFGVTAVYANGNESKPITAQVEVTTGIQQIATDGKPVDVYALDGKLVRQQTKSLDGLKGVYVINGKKVMIK